MSSSDTSRGCSENMTILNRASSPSFHGIGRSVRGPSLADIVVSNESIVIIQKSGGFEKI